ncbi:MAG: carbon-nitrogen hydrolase family protein [Gammaproteobacteria bacterium]|nr:MAG: carbon-nitrogen hydrolase family protein [Gammaproteobacteria bacterium]
MKVKVAVLQMVSNSVVAHNLMQTKRLIKKACDKKARMVLLPENFCCMPKQNSKLLNVAEEYKSGPIQHFLSDLAKELSIWIFAPLPILCDEKDKIKQSLLVYNDKGEEMQRYDKIHLFDVNLPHGESYQESSYTSYGDSLKTVKTPWGIIGLSICYDLRFPQMYRKLVDMGATIIVIPSSFAKTTGQYHWDALLKARAIENLSYVLAADQGGSHPNGRITFGGSTIINPWGQTLKNIPHGSGIIVDTIDTDYIHTIRENFPVLQHKKIYSE